MAYTANSIHILKGLEAVRKRPGMYIGSTNADGLHQLVYEIVDNAVDEAMAGFGKRIRVTIHADNSVTVVDHGRGIPVGIQQETGKPALEVIFTVLHAGGKFNESVYQTSGGLHGVGASVVNAMSSHVTVTVVRNGHQYQEQFQNGGKVVGNGLKDLGPTNAHTGTTVTFKPDKTLFQTTVFDHDTIRDHLQREAFLLRGIELDFIDERKTPVQKDVFKYPEGIKEFVQYLNQDKHTIGPVMYFRGIQQGIEVRLAAQYNDGYTSNLMSFVNNVATPDGGTHVKGFRAAWTRAFNDYGKKTKMIKNKRNKLSGSDVREGLTAVLALDVPEKYLEFEGQTKEKLGTPRARSVVQNIVEQQLGYYLMEHGSLAQHLIDKSSKAKQLRDEARKFRERQRKGKQGKKRQLQVAKKLTPAQSNDSTKDELFLVEGDSAGGSAKQGRDRRYQAILPLRGKVLNTERAKLPAVLKNLELSTIIQTVGAGIDNPKTHEHFDIDKSNYDKIIIMTDADDDGAHIQILLLTFFYNYMRDMILHGRVFIALPPLYKLQNKHGKTKIAYAWAQSDLHQKLRHFQKGNYTLQRFKGLGEMDADQLWETTMNPDKRTLIQVTLDNYDDIKSFLSMKVFMGKKVAPRRNWINHYIHFAPENDNDIFE